MTQFYFLFRIELTKLNSITCDVNKQCIDQIQQIFMKSTIDQLIIDKSTSTSNCETRFRFTSSSPSSVQQHSDEISTSTSHQPPLVLSDNHNSSNHHHHHQQQLPRSTSADAIADAIQKLLQVTNYLVIMLHCNVKNIISKYYLYNTAVMLTNNVCIHII